MSSKTLTQYNSCAFCRVNKQPWNHPMKNMDDEIVCVALLNYKCPFCKEKGHTTKHCIKLVQRDEQRQLQDQQSEKDRHARWEHNQQVKEQEMVRQVEVKANSWAAKAAKAIPEEERQKVEAENIRLKKAEAERQEVAAKKRAEALELERLENKRRYENWYKHKMPQFYGLKVAYGPFPAGSFWEFFIEGRKHNGKLVDHEIARKMRENPENTLKFIHYLAVKYYNWVWNTEETEDDCEYLERLRSKERDEAEYAEEYQERRCREQLQKEEQIEGKMKKKLASGEITEQQYKEWEWDNDEYLDSCLEGESLRWESENRHAIERYDSWQERKAEYEGDTGYKARKEEQRKKDAAERKRISDKIKAEHQSLMESLKK
jgi:hypothetical protein